MDIVCCICQEKGPFKEGWCTALPCEHVVCNKCVNKGMTKRQARVCLACRRLITRLQSSTDGTEPRSRPRGWNRGGPREDRIGAFMRHDVQAVHETLENGLFHIEEKDMHGNTALHYAAGNSKGVEMLSLLFQHQSFCPSALHVRGAEGQTPLHNAAERGSGVEVVSMLLGIPGVNVNARDNYHQTPLHAAVENEEGLGIVGALLRAPGILVNERDITYQTPLHVAAEERRGGLPKVKMLLQHPDFDAFDSVKPDSRGQTPLHLSAQNPLGHEAARRLLRLTAVDVNALDMNKHTALHLAVENSRLDTVRLLLRHTSLCLSSWQNPGSYGWTLLQPAGSGLNREEIVRMILQHTAIDVNATDNAQCTWLHRTTSNPQESVRMVRMLLRLPGVDVNLCNGQKQSAVHLAAGNENGVEMTRTLLGHAKLDGKVCFQPDARGWTPLHHAAANRNGLEIARMLLLLATRRPSGTDLDVNAVDRFQKVSALHLAIRNVHGHEIARLLLQNETVDITSWSWPEADGWFLGDVNRVETMRIVLQRPGVDVNARGEHRRTWLHKAALNDDPESLEMVEVLLDRPGIDVNAIDDRNRTPLHYAVANRNGTAMARKIMEHPEFDPTLLMHQDIDGRTPLLIAKSTGKGTEMARIIVDFVGTPRADEIFGAKEPQA
jgi:ankyrin repeat protein